MDAALRIVQHDAQRHYKLCCVHMVLFEVGRVAEHRGITSGHVCRQQVMVPAYKPSANLLC